MKKSKILVILLAVLLSASAVKAEDLSSEGDRLLKAGNYKEASEIFSRLIVQNPDDTRGFYGRGMALWNLKDYDRAIADFGRVVELEPKASGAWYMRGLAFSRKGLHESAISDFDRAIVFEPGNALLFFCRALSLNAMNEPEKALKDLNQAVALKPDYAAAFKSRADILTKLGDYEGAIADCNKAIKLNTADGDALYYRAMAYDCIGKDERALEDHNRAVELSPKDSTLQNNRGYFLENLGRNDEALTCYDKAIGLNPNFSPFYNNRGHLLLTMGKPDRALADFNKSIELNPQSSKAFCNRALAWLALGDEEKAYADANHTIEIDPREAKAFLIRSELKISQGDDTGAEEDILRARILGPQPRRGMASPVPMAVMARERSALDAFLANDTPESRAVLAAARHERALTILDTNPAKEALEEAVGYAQSATALQPENAGHMFLAGMLFRELEKHDERASVMAEQALREAAEIDPEHSGAWLELGMMMMEQKRDLAAMDALERALESDPARTALAAAGPLCAMYALNDEGEHGLEFFRDLYAENPEVSALGVGIAILLNNIGNKEEAILQAEAVMAIEEPGTPEHDYAAKLAAEWEGDKT